MTPCGRSRGQSRSSCASSLPMAWPIPFCTVSARAPAASNSGLHPSTESALRRFMAKSAPATCSLASASPTAPQCATFGRLIHMPSRNVNMAAGRLARRPSASPLRLRSGCGQVLDEIEKERQIAGRNAFFIKGEDEKTFRRVQQKIGILDPFRNSLVGKQAANRVTDEELLKFLVVDIGVDGHCGS